MGTAFEPMRVASLLVLTYACSGDPAGIRELDPTETRVVPTLAKEASVLRAEMNVAHVYAEDMLDLHRVQGFVTAQDRYVQIELSRRFGAGTLSEVLGDLGVPIDATARGQGMRVVADRIWASSSESTKARFEAFAEGVNAYVTAVQRGQLPVPEEIEIVGGLLKLDDASMAMQPLTGYDIAAVAGVLMSRLGYENTDLTRQNIADQLEALPLNDAKKQALIDDAFQAVRPVHDLVETMPGRSPRALAPRIAKSLARTPVERSMLARTVARTQSFMQLLGKNDDFGSNSWAVSKELTGDKGAILANDGHLPLTVPSLFYQMCLDADYFGGEDFHLCGLFFPGFPILAVGTNGHVAWGQTYLDADITDFYREQIHLGADNLPTETLFKGQWMPVERIDETYRIGDGDEEKVIPRFVTFDGRYLISVEGELLTDEAPNAFFALGDRIAAGDANGDGVIEAISFDWTAFDISDTIEAVDGFNHSTSVAEFKENTKKLVGYAQNIIVADEHGDVMYTGYHALPCRQELDFGPGGNPLRILDGTRFGGFDVSEGNCTVPFDVGPRAESPASGYVLTANHDPLGNGLDDDLGNDQWYIGGPWDLGYRARTIDEALDALTNNATIEGMAAIQSDHHSSLGLQYGPALLAAIETATSAAVLEAKTRLEAWIARGAMALAGVDTFYRTYDAEERKDASATMIFNAWLRRFTELIFEDEGAQFVFGASRSEGTFRALDRMMENGSPLFDIEGTQALESEVQLMQRAMSEVLAELASSEYFGTPDMDQWLWGLQHQVRFKPLLEEVGANNPLVSLIAFKFGLTTELLPLAPDLPASDPRAALEHFPRDGDWFGVDAANPGLTRRAFDYSYGPVMRMVIQLDDGEVRGQNILPGGQSGLIGDPHFHDQAALWLANRTIPLRYTAEEAVEGASGRELFVPSR
jgi:penicillin G amidase